jgi:hypothetical protein
MELLWYITVTFFLFWIGLVLSFIADKLSHINKTLQENQNGKNDIH